MKRLSLMLMFLSCVLIFAASGHETSNSLKQHFQITSKTTSSMNLHFSLPEFEITQISKAGENYQKITIPGAFASEEPGLPELPVITVSIAIPATGTASVKMVGSSTKELSNFHPYPAQDESLPEDTRAFAKNQAFYSGSSRYPAADVICSDPKILRDFRIVNIRINPFVFDAATGKLTVRESMDIKVTYHEGPSVNELDTEPVQYSRAFESIYEANILNFADYRIAQAVSTPPRYLIIHGNTTDATFLAAMNNFALWKRQKGADVDIATTATTSAGTSTSSIQTYIRNRYNNPATRPDFVILIGDTTGSYPVPYFTNNSGGSDYPYTFMNTGDILGDVFIGRISVETLTDFLVVLNKIYLYERDIDISAADWLNRMLLVGDWNPSGISTVYISKYIKEIAIEVNPDYTFTEIYGSDPSPALMNAAINEGVGIYSYRGYIGMSGWSPSASLTNGSKVNHGLLTTCATGNYWNGTGTTESYIRLGSTALPQGGVTAIGMSTSNTHTTFNNVLHGGFVAGIYTYGMRSMGESLLNGKLYMNEIFGVSSPTNVESFTHWANLMGDPTMEIFTAIPDTFAIVTEPVIPVGLSLLDVAVRNAANQSVEGASVVLSLGSTILSRGYTGVDGSVILVLPDGMVAGSAVLTISMKNYKPLIHEINVVQAATLVPAGMTIDDDNSGSSVGNGNSLATAGETVELYFGLRNTGANSMNRITGTLQTNSPWVTVVQADVSYPPIAGGASATNTNPVLIQIAPDTPHETMLRLHLILSDNMGTYFDVSEFVPVEAAKAIFVSYQVADGGNSVLDPGETSQLNLTIKNTGSAVVNNVYGELISDNDLLVVNDSEAFFGSLALNANVSCNVQNNFQVWARAFILPGMVMPMRLRLYNTTGFEQEIALSFTVGNVTVNDPLGPDAYGYVIYDWTDTDYDEAPVYNWIEIAPSLGGLGTPVTLSDVYNSGDEGDQVGAVSTALVNLDFPFQFYGRLYDQITVCSNGFIALGETGNGEFRNFRLPGAMGPSPMIAAFWDDLATHAGSGIYTYFDRQNRSFIIEWRNMLNGKNGTSLETFQIILYDQAAYYTALGDGPIKLQYQTFNNVDSQSGANHGNYSTIGIEDHTGTRGLEYTFNNIYPTAAALLSNGKALYITNNPSMYDAPILEGTINDASIRSNESYLITNLQDVFSSDAYLSYTLVANSSCTGSYAYGIFTVTPLAGWYGVNMLSIRATDPMGRFVDCSFQITVLESASQNQNFDGQSTLPTGWVASTPQVGYTTFPWQVVANVRDGYLVKTTATNGKKANERLTTPSMNLTGYQNTRVRFYMDFLPYGTGTGTLAYSFNNVSYTTIETFSAAYTGYKVYDIPALNNRPSVRIRWTYVNTNNNAGQENHWIVDDFSISSLIPDTVAPLAVTAFNVATINGNTVSFSWNSSYDAFFNRYEIYYNTGTTVSINDMLYSTTQNSAMGYMNTLQVSIPNLLEGVYTAAIRAVDNSGNASELSAPVTFILGSFPTEPQNLTITAMGDDVVLDWDAVSTDILGNPIFVETYNVYMADYPDFACDEEHLIDVVNESECTLAGVANTFSKKFFKVTALAE